MNYIVKDAKIQQPYLSDHCFRFRNIKTTSWENKIIIISCNIVDLAQEMSVISLPEVNTGRDLQPPLIESALCYFFTAFQLFNQIIKFFSQLTKRKMPGLIEPWVDGLG